MADTVYTIHGYIKGGTTGMRAVLAIFGMDKIPDTAVFKGEEFEFKGRVTEPLMGEITLLDDNDNYSQPLKLIVENAYINIEGNKDSIHTAKVIGGVQNTDFETLKKVLRLYTDSSFQLLVREQEAIRMKDTAQLNTVKSQFASMEKETRNVIKQYAVEHPKSISSAFYVYQELAHYVDMNELDSVYRSFDSSIHNTLYVKKIRQTLDAFKRTAIGRQAPELNINNPDIDTVRLASYQGKYVLIDFWASWCELCRKHNPNLVNAYNKYKNKGFDVIGVSLDQHKQDWQRVIKKDNLTWNQVSDFKGWESSVVNLYAIDTIPANYLLDKQGKIIAKNLYGEALNKKLQEVIQ